MGSKALWSERAKADVLVVKPEEGSLETTRLPISENEAPMAHAVQNHLRVGVGKGELKGETKAAAALRSPSAFYQQQHHNFVHGFVNEA